MRIPISILMSWFLLIPNLIHAQTFIKTFGGSSDDYGYSIVPTSDCGFIAVGGTGSFGAGGDDIYVVKLDKDGNVQWTKTFGGAFDDAAMYVMETSAGDYIISGHTKSYGTGSGSEDNLFTMKLDAFGALQWMKVHGGSNWERGGGIIELSSGNIVNGYATRATSAADAMVTKYHSSGTVLQNFRYDVTSVTENDALNDVIELPSGKLVWAMQGEDYGWGSHEAGIMITDTNLNILSTILFGNTGQEYCMSIAYRDGKLIVTGDTESYGAGGRDIYLAVIDTLGTISFFKTYGSTSREEPISVITTPDGGYAILGQSQGFGSGGFDIILIKTDSLGNHEWTRTYGGTADEYIPRAWVNNTLFYDDGYVFTMGSSAFAAVPNDEMVVIKTDTLGMVTGCAVGSATPVVNSYTVPIATVSYTRSASTWDLSTSPTINNPSVTAATACYNGMTSLLLLTDDTLICYGESVDLEATGGVSFSWSPSASLSASTGPTVTATPTKTTEYIVEVTTSTGCILRDTVTIHVNDTIAAVNNSDTTVCLGDFIKLSATEGLTCAWSPPDYLDNPGIHNPISTPTSDVTYSVIIDNGVCGIDSFTIDIDVIECDISLLGCWLGIPNAFSPNKDGLNDIFKPVSECIDQIDRFVVFNRYGEPVFDSNLSDRKGWNGKFNGKDSDVGVYVWVLECSLTDGTYIRDKGSVTLIR